MTAVPKLAAALALATFTAAAQRTPGAVPPEGPARAPRSVGASVRRSVGASDSVRRLDVAIVLLTNSFNKVLTPAEVERVHEEVAEFYAFYQQHGAGKVDFHFSLIEIDRPLARGEIGEVSPGRYYLSREDLERELVARGFRGRFDEVVALHAWSNANPERALQAYGGGAVGPDGQFLGDAGWNSIPVMGRDPNTIGQVLIHEVLHNLDDMFARSGMPDEFFNADEMSRNMPQLLRERPGAFLPRYTDAEMLAYADRERQGREAYPWAMQLVYYGWMLERTPKASWDRLRFGRMAPRTQPAVRPLYAEIFTASANDSTYLPVLAPDGAAVAADGLRLAARHFEQTDFDGTVISRGTFYAAWVPIRGERDTAYVTLGGRVVRTAVRVRFVARRSWRVSDDGPLSATLGSPLTVNAFVREDQGRNDVAVAATIGGRRVPLVRTGDGRYSVTVPGDLAPGLHWARLAATDPGGAVVTDSVRVYVRPGGWIRPPATFARAADGSVPVSVAVESRMGEDVRGAHLPLVAIVGDAVVPLVEADSSGTYSGVVRAPPSAARLVLASLVGDLQRRVVELAPAGAAPAASPAAAAARAALPPYAAAIRLVHPPLIDGDLSDWPPTAAQPAVLGPESYLLTDPSVYHGARDLSARLRFAWDDSTLYLAGEITDDSVTAGDAWDSDRANFVFDMKHDTSPLTYPSANPPLNEWQDDDYWVFFRFGEAAVRRFGKVNADPIPGARVATRRTASGWAYEAAIPRAALPGYVPFVGQVAGLQVFLTDGDGDRTATELMWSARWPYGADGLEWRLAELGTLLFTDGPIP